MPERTSDELRIVTELMREVSRLTDPQQVLRTYEARARSIFAMDRTISLSRRELKFPFYRITRSDQWTVEIDPWKQRDRLPLLQGGLLSELIYAGEPTIIDDVKLNPDDPAADQLAGMGALAAIPHFDNGVAVNMVIHLRRHAGAFDHAQFPQLVLLSGLFGRVMRGLVLADELRGAEERLHTQYLAVSELSDTVLEQARAIKAHATMLEVRVRQRTVELEAAHLDAIYMLAAASEAKDDNTGNHVRRIGDLAHRLAARLGRSDSAAREIGRAAILHDVGKIHVPDSILKKAGPLTAQERQTMQEHTVRGERILADREYFAQARHVARSHHENWDGTGYPDGLRGDSIPPEARIVHIVDVYDALINARPYKRAWPAPEARRFIETEKGRMFDPIMADTFLGMLNEI